MLIPFSPDTLTYMSKQPRRKATSNSVRSLSLFLSLFLSLSFSLSLSLSLSLYLSLSVSRSLAFNQSKHDLPLLPPVPPTAVNYSVSATCCLLLFFFVPAPCLLVSVIHL